MCTQTLAVEIISGEGKDESRETENWFVGNNKNEDEEMFRQAIALSEGNEKESGGEELQWNAIALLLEDWK